jgi:hypothetical protein
LHAVPDEPEVEGVNVGAVTLSLCEPVAAATVASGGPAVKLFAESAAFDLVAVAATADTTDANGETP